MQVLKQHQVKILVIHCLGTLTQPIVWGCREGLLFTWSMTLTTAERNSNDAAGERNEQHVVLFVQLQRDDSFVFFTIPITSVGHRNFEIFTVWISGCWCLSSQAYIDIVYFVFQLVKIFSTSPTWILRTTVSWKKTYGSPLQCCTLQPKRQWSVEEVWYSQRNQAEFQNSSDGAIPTTLPFKLPGW